MAHITLLTGTPSQSTGSTEALVSDDERNALFLHCRARCGCFARPTAAHGLVSRLFGGAMAGLGVWLGTAAVGTHRHCRHGTDCAEKHFADPRSKQTSCVCIQHVRLLGGRWQASAPGCCCRCQPVAARTGLTDTAHTCIGVSGLGTALLSWAAAAEHLLLCSA